MLKVKNLTKSFGKFKAVDNVSFEISDDELVAIIGPNGAGKSTLYNLITGRLIPDSGEVYFNGERINGLPPHRICQKGLSLSFQIVNLFDDFTPFENVRVPVISRLRKYRNIFTPIASISELNEETKKIMESVNLSDTGFHTKFLPHSEKKRIELTIGLGVKPSFLLLDEPTAGMGAKEVEFVINLIKKISKEMKVAVVFTEHDLDVVFNISERIIVMNRGCIVKDGPPTEIKTDEQVKEIYGF